ncbi:MAG TPA: hypothetical protein VF653_10335, partial [Methylomirabilota bacterium]
MPVATLNGLMKATQTEVELTEAAKALLSRETVTIRRISASIYGLLCPPRPAALLEGLPTDLDGPARVRWMQDRELAWLAEDFTEERIRYRVAMEKVKFRAVAEALVEPKMTTDEVERLGDEVNPIYLRLLVFS